MFCVSFHIQTSSVNEKHIEKRVDHFPKGMTKVIGMSVENVSNHEQKASFILFFGMIIRIKYKFKTEINSSMY